MNHIPVLLDEVIEYLKPTDGTKFIDGTAGGGGHIRAILQANPRAKVLGIDLDQTSLDKLRSELIQEGLGQRCTLVVGNYKDLDQFAVDAGFEDADGILLDLGFSSLQLDQASRGFSFQNSGPLDMRYGQSNPLTASQIVNRYSVGELTQIIGEYGEEKFSRRIALAIVQTRTKQAIETTDQLAEVIRKALPLPIRFKASDNIRRVFQALRIAVNSELDNLRQALPHTLQVLKPGGRLAVISFHSLEDRIVKEFFQSEAKDCICPPEFPTCVCGKTSTMRILTRKPIVAGEREAVVNPRSKSAKLRVAQKI